MNDRPQDPRSEEFRRQVRISYLDRKLRDYTKWAPNLRLEDPDSNPDELYRELSEELDELANAEALPVSRIPPFPDGEEIPLPDWRELGELKINNSDIVALQKLTGLVGATFDPDCFAFQCLARNIQPAFQPNPFDVAGGSTIYFTTSIWEPGTQGFYDVNLRDVKKWWRRDSSDSASGLIELRVDFPQNNSDVVISWFTEVHLIAKVIFGAKLEEGTAQVDWGMRVDVTSRPENLAQFDIPSTVTQVTFVGGEDWVLASSSGSPVIEGDGTPWENNFQVAGQQMVPANQTLVLRFYARGSVSALGGRTRLRFGHGLYDSLAIENGTGFIQSVHGIRYTLSQA